MQIVMALAHAGGTMTGVELRDALNARQRDVLSKHLRELRNAGVVTYPDRATIITLETRHLMAVAQLLRRLAHDGQSHHVDGGRDGCQRVTPKNEASAESEKQEQPPAPSRVPGEG